MARLLNGDVGEVLDAQDEHPEREEKLDGDRQRTRGKPVIGEQADIEQRMGRPQFPGDKDGEGTSAEQRGSARCSSPGVALP